MEVLLKTRLFTSTAVGIGGNTPIQCYAFKAILNQPDATRAFSELLRRGQPAGQMFGLCGLYLCDRKAFDQEVKPYLASDRIVFTFFGCIRGMSPAWELVVKITSGEWPEEFKTVPNSDPEDARDSREQEKKV